MHFSNLLIPALYWSSSEAGVTVCKCLKLPLTEFHMANPSQVPSNSQSSEGRLDSEMTSVAEPSVGYCAADEYITVCGGSAACEATSANVTSAAESTDDTYCLSDLFAQELEMTVSDTTDGMAQDADPWRVIINDLPDEVLIKIFSHMSFTELIDVLPCVCSRWKRLSQDSELWIDKEYEIRYWSESNSNTCKSGMTDEEAIRTFFNTPNLRSVNMLRGAKSRVFRALYSNCHRLSKLRLNYAQKLSYSVLKNLVENCSRIHTLRISNELLKSENFSEAVSRLQHLRVLELEEHFTQSAPLLKHLGDGCPQLAEVDFGCMTVNMDDLRYFLSAKRNTLTSIRIKWVMVGKRCVLPLLTVCANSLERLQLYEFDIVRDEAREAFTALGSLKNLRELKTALIDPPPSGAAALAFRSGGLPKLNHLDLRDGFGLDNETVIAISRGCPGLRELDVRGAELLSDAAFSQIYRLEHLEILDVSCCKGLGGALMPYLARLPRLHTLFMEEMEFPKLQPGLTSIVELSSLRCLILNNSLVRGIPFDKFPGKLVSLRELNIRWCRGDPKATDGLTEQMPDLDIHGDIDEEELADDTEGHESDVDLAEEEIEENAGPGDADEAQDANSGGDEDSDSDCESESDNVIWGGSISVLFLEDVNE